MSKMVLKAEMRTASSRGELNRLRRTGRVPGVVYGKNAAGPVPISVDEKDLQSLLRTNPHGIVKLDIPGSGQVNALITELQRETMSRNIVHIDFHQINMNEKIKAPVRLEVSGKSAGEREGGMLQLILHELEVECMPTDLPDSIILPVENMQVGDSLTVGDLKLPPGVETAQDPDTVIAAVLAPQKEISEEQTEAAEEAAEEHTRQA